MKKTFKVKNILNKAYNFKSPILLSALSLMVAFGITSCEKDPVDPVRKEKPAIKTPEELKREQEEKNLKELDSLAYNAKYVTQDISKVFDKNFKKRFNDKYMPMVKDKYLATILTYKSIVDSRIITYGNAGEKMPNEDTMLILHKRCIELLKEANYNENLPTSTSRNIVLNIQKQR